MPPLNCGSISSSVSAYASNCDGGENQGPRWDIRERDHRDKAAARAAEDQREKHLHWRQSQPRPSTRHLITRRQQRGVKALRPTPPPPPVRRSPPPNARGGRPRRRACRPCRKGRRRAFRLAWRWVANPPWRRVAGASPAPTRNRRGGRAARGGHGGQRWAGASCRQRRRMGVGGGGSRTAMKTRSYFADGPSDHERW